MTPTPFLKISGNQLVDGSGAPVILRGFGLGGWLNMENFITGYPANEEAQRQALLQALGPEKVAFFQSELVLGVFREVAMLGGPSDGAGVFQHFDIDHVGDFGFQPLHALG